MHLRQEIRQGMFLLLLLGNIYNPVGNNRLIVPSAQPLNASMMSLISENSSLNSESPPLARCAVESRRLYNRRRSSDQTPQLSVSI